MTAGKKVKRKKEEEKSHAQAKKNLFLAF